MPYPLKWHLILKFFIGVFYDVVGFEIWIRKKAYFFGQVLVFYFQKNLNESKKRKISSCDTFEPSEELFFFIHDTLVGQNNFWSSFSN